MLHFYKRIVMFALFVLIGADVDDFGRTNREYQIYEKLLDVSNGSVDARPHRNVVLPNPNATASPVRNDNAYGEFEMVQSNLLRVTTTPVYKLPALNRTLPSDRGSAARMLRTPVPRNGVKAENATLEIIESARGEQQLQQWVGIENRTLFQVAGNARAKRKHDGVKKKKKKHGGLNKVFKRLWHHISKMMPNFSKMHGPAMFMLGMAQANFNNFVMHALMMSKMALISVFMMIMREVVFGDKDNPVRYYNFGYEHPYPHHHHYRRYGYYEPQISDDYQQYDYNKHRRKRQVVA